MLVPSYYLITSLVFSYLFSFFIPVTSIQYSGLFQLYLIILILFVQSYLVYIIAKILGKISKAGIKDFFDEERKKIEQQFITKFFSDGKIPLLKILLIIFSVHIVVPLFFPFVSIEPIKDNLGTVEFDGQYLTTESMITINPAIMPIDINIPLLGNPTQQDIQFGPEIVSITPEHNQEYTRFEKVDNYTVRAFILVDGFKWREIKKRISYMYKQKFNVDYKIDSEHISSITKDNLTYYINWLSLTNNEKFPVFFDSMKIDIKNTDLLWTELKKGINDEHFCYLPMIMKDSNASAELSFPWAPIRVEHKAGNLTRDDVLDMQDIEQNVSLYLRIINIPNPVVAPNSNNYMRIVFMPLRKELCYATPLY
jgi:hypothetical protein